VSVVPICSLESISTVNGTLTSAPSLGAVIDKVVPSSPVAVAASLSPPHAAASKPMAATAMTRAVDILGSSPQFVL
jgi:hypothetical protein